MKVKLIRKAPNEDVYNMEVEQYRNFAVNGGIIVHNCDALRGFCVSWTSAAHTPETSKTYNFEFEKPKRSIEGAGEKVKII